MKPLLQEHHLDIEPYLKEGIHLALCNSNRRHASFPGAVSFDEQAYSELSDNKELALAIEKKFKGKRTSYGTPTYRDLVLWCLSTSRYSICSANLRDVSDAEVRKAWGMITTTSTSSTKTCSELMERHRNGRSEVGFSRERMPDAPVPKGSLRSLGNVVPSSSMSYSTRDCEGHVTLEDVIAEDYVELSLNSGDPLSAVRSFRMIPNVLKRA